MGTEDEDNTHGSKVDINNNKNITKTCLYFKKGKTNE